ncbi:MAG: 16S rRNA (guanine(966)-N(2))-methyltransferase RsmD [Cyanobacteria bacterium P01_D01_bin.36]
MAVRIYGNRQIKTLPGEATRPTSSKVREALFNIWQGRVLGARWLDLCAGSGAMGAEALCRGAAEVVGIEKSAAACRVVKENWQKVAKSEQAYEVLYADVVKSVASRSRISGDGLPEGDLFDLVYFDPPYASGLYLPVLSQLPNCLANDGEVAVEYGGGHWSPAQLPSAVTDKLDLVREKRYGSTNLAFFRHR